MIQDYKFKLTPAYCLFNGVGIIEQNGSYIRFLLENSSDEVLKGRLERAFKNHIENISKIDSSPDIFRYGMRVEYEKGTRAQLRKLVSVLYKAEDKNLNAEVKLNSEKKNDYAAAVVLLDTILAEARFKKATDIHIEKNIVRFRINGILEKEMKIQQDSCYELVQRIKLLAGMNVLEKRKSQDGHFIYGNKKPLFVRVSSMSVIDEKEMIKESIVLRLLDTTRVPLSIDFLGFNKEQLNVIEMLEQKKNGLVIVCGPTGSGKSTTLASILTEIVIKKEEKVKIISLEDPPEYMINGVTQIHIDEKNNYKSALEHIFRQDPDVIMVGEIRDEEGANVALRAALTGHLVFATLHTGSVGECLLRIENLGIERELIASVLRGIICQELNFIDDQIKLYADIGIPVEKFSAKLKSEYGEEELEELFVHYTNYSEIFKKTVEMLNSQPLPSLPDKAAKSKKRSMWKGDKSAAEVYKRIV